MKRVKVALTAFAIVAVVGGALAFKPVFGSRVCYIASDKSSGVATCAPGGTTLTCSTGPELKKITTPGDNHCYRTVSAGTNCATVTCPNLANIENE